MYFRNLYDMDELDELDELDQFYNDECMYCPFNNMYRQPIIPIPPTMPPSGGAPQGSSQGGPPTGPPPSKAPQSPQTKAVDPGAISRCLYRFVYIWPRRGRPFWAWLVFIGRTSVAGWRWNGFTWIWFGMDLRQIDSFVCL